MLSTTLYYFTGTGNSLFIAEKVKESLQDAVLVPVLSLLKDQTKIVAPECLGFVFPVYQAILPLAVKQVMEKMDFSNCTYIFALATRTGTTHRAFEMMQDILNKQGKTLNLFTSINMANNDPKFKYHVPTEQEIQGYEKEITKTLAHITDKINAFQDYRPEDVTYHIKTPALGLLAMAARLTERFYGGFYADEHCTGCGLCQKICTSQKIIMNAHKPQWKKEIACYKCSACLNYCPVSAVQIKRFTEKNGRYSHPYATAEDIMSQRD